MASDDSMSANEAANVVFGGNAAALTAAESEAERLAELWLQWFREEGYGVPQACRLDFLCTSKGKLWTVELCECGGSLCGLSAPTRTAACLNECLSGEGSTNIPKSLPPFKVLFEGSPVVAAPNGGP